CSLLLRRSTGHGSKRFYIFCLTSFIFYTFHYTSKFNEFDWIMYWGNVVAWLLQPALFLHFVLTFPERRDFVPKNHWLLPLVYVPGLILLSVHTLIFAFLRASELLRRNLDRVGMAYQTTLLSIPPTVLSYRYRRASTPVMPQ